MNKTCCLTLPKLLLSAVAIYRPEITMKCLIFVALFVSYALAQPFPVERCRRTPVAQWMGELHESNHESMDPRDPNERLAYIFYDATNQRINITEREIFEPMDRTSRITEIYLHKADPPMRYRVDIATGQCESERLNSTFRPFGVPSGATFHGIDYLGAELAGLGLLVDSFSGEMDGGHYHGFWAPTPNNSSCVPIVETYRNVDAPVPRRTNIYATFRNISPVTATKPFPPDTFTVPAACRQRSH